MMETKGAAAAAAKTAGSEVEESPMMLRVRLLREARQGSGTLPKSAESTAQDELNALWDAQVERSQAKDGAPKFGKGSRPPKVIGGG